VEITADSTAQALPDGDTISVGLGAGEATAKVYAGVDRVTEAYVGTPAWTTPTALTELRLGTDDLLIKANSNLTANASPLGISIGLGGAGGSTYSIADITGATLAYVGENTNVIAGELDVIAKSIENATANNVTVAVGGVVAVSAADATATISSDTEAFTGARSGAHHSSTDVLNELSTGERVMLATDIGSAKAGRYTNTSVRTAWIRTTRYRIMRCPPRTTATPASGRR